MAPTLIFQVQLVLGYVAWLLFFGLYVLPRFKTMDRVDVQRAIATLHSFRFFGLIFILPGIVGPNLPAGFASFAAYGDFATGLLAMLALLTRRIRPLFWLFVVAFNLVGAVDIIGDYYHAFQFDLASLPGELGAAYAVPIIYVPVLMITHVIAFYFMIRPQSIVVRSHSRDVVASGTASAPTARPMSPADWPPMPNAPSSSISRATSGWKGLVP